MICLKSNFMTNHRGTFEVLFRPENLFKAMCLIVIDMSRVI